MESTEQNPYSSPRVTEQAAPKIEKRIDNLYRNCKQMSTLSVLGLFVPIVLVIAAPVGLLYAFQRSKLLHAVAAGKLAVPTAPGRPGQLSAREQIDYLRQHSIRLLVPAFIVGGVIFVGGISILSARGSKPARPGAPSDMRQQDTRSSS